MLQELRDAVYRIKSRKLKEISSDAVLNQCYDAESWNPVSTAPADQEFDQEDVDRTKRALGSACDTVLRIGPPQSDNDDVLDAEEITY